MQKECPAVLWASSLSTVPRHQELFIIPTDHPSLTWLRSDAEQKSKPDKMNHDTVIRVAGICHVIVDINWVTQAF